MTAAVAATVAAACSLSQAPEYTGSVALDFLRFYWGGKGARWARACEVYLIQREFRRALPKELRVL
jgi:hypothetical protein